MPPFQALVPFQLFAPNSLLGHPTANRRLFGPHLSPDQVGTALAQCVDTCVAGQSGSDSYPITNYSLAQILAPIIAGRPPKEPNPRRGRFAPSRRHREREQYARHLRLPWLPRRRFPIAAFPQATLAACRLAPSR